MKVGDLVKFKNAPISLTRSGVVVCKARLRYQTNAESDPEIWFLSIPNALFRKVDEGEHACHLTDADIASIQEHDGKLTVSLPLSNLTL